MTRTRQLWREQPGVFRAWIALVLYNAALGTVLVAGGPARVAGPAFTLVRDSGGHLVWGVGFIAIGVLLCLGVCRGPRTAAVVLLLGAIAHGWFTAQFVASAVVVPYAGLTGCVTYLLIAFWHASVAAVFNGHRPRRTPERSDPEARWDLLEPRR